MKGGTLQEAHAAIVVDNRDPQKLGRLKLKCQTLTGADFQLPTWIEPQVQMFTSVGGGAALWLPAIKSTVILVCDVSEAMDDIPNERFMQNPGFKWRPAPLGKAMPLPSALAADYPNTRGFVTPAGHRLLFNDKGDIEIRSKGGAKVLIKDDTIEVLTNGPVAGLPTLAEVTAITSHLAALQAYLQTFTLPVSGATAGPPAVPPPTAPAAPTGTQVFKTH